MKTLINNLPRKFKTDSGKKWGIAGGILLIAVIIGIVIAVVLKPTTRKAPTTENFATIPAVTENLTTATSTPASTAPVATIATTGPVGAAESSVVAAADAAEKAQKATISASNKLGALAQAVAIAKENSDRLTQFDIHYLKKFLQSVSPFGVTFTGNVIGNVIGNVNGSLTGVAADKYAVIGNVTGAVTGNITGDVKGDVNGNVQIPKEGYLSLKGSCDNAKFTHGPTGGEYYIQSMEDDNTTPRTDRSTFTYNY